MRYRNKVTGAVIDVSSVIGGEDWELCAPASPKAEETAPKKTAKKAAKKTEKE